MRKFNILTEENLIETILEKSVNEIESHLHSKTLVKYNPLITEEQL